MAGTYLLVMRCPVQKGRESSLGFRAELENLVGEDKGKGTSGRTVQPKVPRDQPTAVGTTWEASKLGGLNVMKCLQPSKRLPRKSCFRG
jgi:hypothetical protein